MASTFFCARDLSNPPCHPSTAFASYPSTASGTDTNHEAHNQYERYNICNPAPNHPAAVTPISAIGRVDFYRAATLSELSTQDERRGINGPSFVRQVHPFSSLHRQSHVTVPTNAWQRCGGANQNGSMFRPITAQDSSPMLRPRKLAPLLVRARI